MSNLLIKAAAGLLYIFLAISALIFVPAWTLNYRQAWTFLTVFMISICAIFLYLARYDPHLLARRVKTREKEQSQKIIRSLLNLAFSAAIVISALDFRYAWSAMPSWVSWAGDLVVVVGLLTIFFVFRENTFTAQTVEVEAGQKVISTGPYALVRHPMYLGGLVFISGIPLALGSGWGLSAIVLFLPALAWRILNEEKLLAEELPGYPEYRNRVRYRLVPFVW